MTHESDLSQLIQERAVIDVLLSYCASVDEVRLDDISMCFTPDCLFDGGHGRIARGRAEMRQFAEARLKLYESTSHHLSNCQVQFRSADEASSRSYVFAFHRLHASKRVALLWGRYDDEFVRSNEGWFIRSRRLRVADDDGFDPTPGYATAFERYRRG